MLRLSQRAYIDHMLKRVSMQSYASGKGHVVEGDKFSTLQCPKNDFEIESMKWIPYVFVFRSLMYGQICSKLDIFAISMLRWF